VSHTHTSLNYHIIFGTKGRAESINANVRADLCRYLGGIIKSEGGVSLEINAVADHVHLLLRL
jgi:REP element-mobilizing transposase RayT